MPELPDGFTWGVATSAYQIEGAATEDGRGTSIWDTFTAGPGRIADGTTGADACDHYHRYGEDVALMADLGVGAYRFSIAWPRVQPDGSGPANAAGLAFYDRLVDALLEKGILPAAMLFHWDLPQPLQDNGGWLNRDTAHRLGDYAGLVADALGDRVGLWMTLNEPVVHMSLGYALGSHAPGETRLQGALPAAHHQLLGHGFAVAALRDRTSRPVAIVNSYSPARPASDSPADVAAAEAYESVWNRLFTDPLLGRGYPPDTVDAGVVAAGDLDVIAAPLDALGINYYNPTGVRAPEPGSPLPFEIVPIEGYPLTAFGWPVVPDGLRELLLGLRDRYGTSLPPVYITENGCAYDDVVGPDGRCDDPRRIAYLSAHIDAVRDARAAGVDVRGYFVWSLLDNWEWAEGFTKRFGLVHVDYATQRRTPKSSYHWFKERVRDGR